jgi:3-oxoacyl-[acyl-carrier-protein] synthase-3
MTTPELAAEAGARALKSAGTAEADAVLVATATPGLETSATAREVAVLLGLGCVPAVDVPLDGAGFVHGLAAATSLITAGLATRVLVIGADGAPGSGHRAGAVVLRAGTADEEGAFGPFDVGDDDAFAELSDAPGGAASAAVAGAAPYEDDGLREKLFESAVALVSYSARQVLADVGWTGEALDHVVAHRGNQHLFDAVVAELGIPGERVVTHDTRAGGDSAASLPLALTDAWSSGVLRPGHRVLLAACGDGPFWGLTVLRWPTVTVITS